MSNSGRALRELKDRNWQEYPIGTKAHAVTGGHWIRVSRGWKWCTGDTFPAPGADAVGRCVELPADDFALECARRKICPACLNAGESDDHNLDLFGVCANCGHEPPNFGEVLEEERERAIAEERRRR